MRLILTIVILSITSISIAFGQSGNTSSTHKSEENNTGQTEASSNYYINERGLAVYRKNPINATAVKTSKTDSTKTETITKMEIKVDSNTNVRPATNQTTVNNNSHIEKRTSSFFLKKDPKPIESPISKETVVTNKTEEIETPNVVIPNKEEKVIVKNIISVLGSGNTNKEEVSRREEIEEDEEEIIVEKPTTDKKKSVFDRKRESQYKTLEEAALAVEALLEDLKKDQQTQSGSAGSMSARLSRGANKSLRKEASTPIIKSSNSKPTETSKPTTVSPPSKKVQENPKNSVSDETDNLPSYFINGQQVEKIDIDRLRKKDIISKEVRIRNTVTGNPNGEVWYEVK